MRYVVLMAFVFISLDILRSAIAVRQAIKHFRMHNDRKLKIKPKTQFGRGSDLHIAILGDSTFDVRGDSKVIYGAAQAFINDLSRNHKIHVHMLAKSGAKSHHVARLQLPQLKKLPHVGLVIAYMGANDAFRLNNPFTVGKSYAKLFKYTEKHKIPVVASEIANYWHLSIFALVHRALLYIFIHLQNFTIRQAAANCKYVTVVKTKPYHKQIHKNRFSEPYLSDGVHPNDKTAVEWGNYLLEHARRSPATASVFSGRSDLVPKF